MLVIEGVVHPELHIVSSFTHPCVALNLRGFISVVEHKRQNVRVWQPQSLLTFGVFFFHTSKVNGDWGVIMVSICLQYSFLLFWK